MWVELGLDSSGTGIFLWVCRCGSREIEWSCSEKPGEDLCIVAARCVFCGKERTIRLPKSGRQCGGSP